MKQMVNAYHDIVNSPDYAYLERRRLMDAMDTNQAINNAKREAKREMEVVYSKQLADKDVLLADKDGLLAGKDALLADKDAEIARLREQLGENS